MIHIDRRLARTRCRPTGKQNRHVSVQFSGPDIIAGESETGEWLGFVYLALRGSELKQGTYDSAPSAVSGKYFVQLLRPCTIRVVSPKYGIFIKYKVVQTQ